MKTPGVPIACALILALAPLLAHAQADVVCTEQDTFDTCADRLAGRAPQIVAEREAEAKAVDEKRSPLMAAMNTGDTTTPTISDFLPLLRLLLDQGGSTDDTPDKIGLEWNNPLHLNKRNQNKLSVVVQKSAMFAPLKEALQAASLGDEASKLEDGINQGDDVHLSFSYSRASEKMGRDPDLQDRLMSKILHGASSQALTQQQQTVLSDARKAREDFIAAKHLDDFISDDDGNALPFKAVPAASRAQYMALTQAQISAEIVSVRALAAKLASVNFYRVLDLVNNQPQLVATFDYNARDEVVGPDEFKALLTYETGGPNINEFRRFAKDRCAADENMVCLASYLDDPDVRSDLESGSVHFKFSAEYSQIQRMEFALPTAQFSYLAKPVKHLAVTAGLGRYFGKELVGHSRARLDANLSYEDFSDDPLRQDRGLVAFTVTYPVGEGFFLSVGAVYATKPEFRGDVNQEISARAGFTYKIIEGK